MAANQGAAAAAGGAIVPWRQGPYGVMAQDVRTLITPRILDKEPFTNAITACENDIRDRDDCFTVHVGFFNPAKLETVDASGNLKRQCRIQRNRRYATTLGSNRGPADRLVTKLCVAFVIMAQVRHGYKNDNDDQIVVPIRSISMALLRQLWTAIRWFRELAGLAQAGHLEALLESAPQQAADEITDILTRANGTQALILELFASLPKYLYQTPFNAVRTLYPNATRLQWGALGATHLRRLKTRERQAAHAARLHAAQQVVLANAQVTAAKNAHELVIKEINKMGRYV